MIIAFVFLFVRFLEMRFIIKENLPLKKIVKDGVFVYFSVLGGVYIIQQLEPFKGIISSPEIFTSPPDF
jgi:hypothetical protein